MKRRIKRVIGALAPVALLAARSPSLTILMYHRVLPVGHPDTAVEQPGMWVAPEVLDAQLQALRQFFDVMHLDEWLRQSASGGSLPKRALCVTFDDGWRDNFDFAFPVLSRLGVPATIFLISGLVGRTYELWPTRVALMLHAYWGRGPRAPIPAVVEALARELTPLQRALGTMVAVDAAIDLLKSKLDCDVERILGEAAGLYVPLDRNMLNVDEIMAMRQSNLVKFGSHTKGHVRLNSSLENGAIQSEVKESRKELEALLGEHVELFAYPNGETSAVAIDQARREYLGAVTTRAGWNARSTDVHVLRRIGMHNGTGRERSLVLGAVVSRAWSSQ